MIDSQSLRQEMYWLVASLFPLLIIDANEK